MIGLYGTISYSVAQRTREIGIRMAMGAQRGTLTGMFLGTGWPSRPLESLAVWAPRQ